METHAPKERSHENYLYKLNEQANSITITNYKGQSKSLIIPSAIDGTPVTEIGRFAFSRNQLKEIIIPSSVTKIGQTAFAYNQLTELIIPEGIAEIGWAAFANNQLTNVTIPYSITHINHHAFRNNFYLKKIIIPDHTQIHDDSFEPTCQITRHSDQNKLISELLTKKQNLKYPGNLSL